MSAGQVSYLSRLLPHASTVMCAKDAGTMDVCVKRARAGGQLILLRNTGFWVDQIAEAVDDAAALARSAGHKRKSTLLLPADVRSSQFLVFDTLRESAPNVAEKITKSLSMASREEASIIGFGVAESARLLSLARVFFPSLRSASFGLDSFETEVRISPRDLRKS